MKIVIDTNIIISALLKDSTTRRIILDSKWNFYYPEISLQEIRRHKELILKKSGMKEEAYAKTLDKIFMHIKMVPGEQANLRLKEAIIQLQDIDPDDVIFLATALSIEGAVIWSEDIHFEKQNKVKVFKTKEIISLFFEEKIKNKR